MVPPDDRASRSQGWYFAYLNGQTGVVPGNYLSDADDTSTAAAHVASVPSPDVLQWHVSTNWAFLDLRVQAGHMPSKSSLLDMTKE